MEVNDNLYQDFLGELQNLDDFRAEYATRYDFEALGRDDQDVRRLIEAMAFYSARTRRAAERALDQHRRRALQSLFPYLLTPLPAMGLLYPELGSNTKNARRLPAHASFSVTSADGPEEARYRFRTLSTLEIFPLHVVRGSTSLIAKRLLPKRRLLSTGAADVAGSVLRFDVAPSANSSVSGFYTDEPAVSLRELRVWLNPAGDVLFALRRWDALAASFQKAVCRFYLRQGEPVSLELSKIDFEGRGRDAADAGWTNPIERLRRMIHFPQASFGFCIPLTGAPSAWQRLEVELWLDDGWPRTLSFDDSSFLLNAEVVENLERSVAEPVAFNGTEQRLPVNHPNPASGMRLREVLGVYRFDPTKVGDVRSELPNALVEGGYEIDIEGAGHERSGWLEFITRREPGPIPETLYVDAEWYDPSSRVQQPRDAVVRAEAFDVADVNWRLAEPMSPPGESPVLSNARSLEQLLSLNAKPIATSRELRTLLHAMGVERSELFSRVPRLLQNVELRRVPRGQRSRGALVVYEIELSKVPPTLAPAVRFLMGLLPELLAIWTGEPAVAVNLTFESEGEAISSWFEWSATDE